ncbi:MAG: acylneuraminate cytidylyltransferase [Bdellovibrionaceae bacterium]|nr:acylneuraminate cytidylyltransferase [Pseudobdellovibrionaceae bacterium]
MKTIIVASLLSLSFATGFTCSKNQPAETTTTTTTQEQMAAPAADATPVDAAPAAEPTATPMTETK